MCVWGEGGSFLYYEMYDVFGLKYKVKFLLYHCLLFFPTCNMN